METSSDSQLREVKLWDTKVTLRLVALEQQDQRQVYISRTNMTITVANVICASDSGEQLKVALWGEQAAGYYDMFQPGHLLELASFKAIPSREGQFRVGNMHFELSSQAQPLQSSVRILRTNYKLRGPPKSYASVVASNVPGRHKIDVSVLDKFVKSGEAYLGPVEMEDFTVEKPLKIIVTLQQVYPIERHHLVRGQGMTLVGTIEAKGGTFYMNVLSWDDVMLHGFDERDEREPPPNFGLDRGGGNSNANKRDREAYSTRYTAHERKDSHASNFARGRSIDSFKANDRERDAKAVRYSLPQRQDAQLSAQSPAETVSFYGRTQRDAQAAQRPGYARDVSRGSSDEGDRETHPVFGHTRTAGCPPVNDWKREVKVVQPLVQDRDVPQFSNNRSGRCSERDEYERRSVRVSLQKPQDDPGTKVCPVLSKCTTVAELEAADLLADPWHMIQGEICDSFEQKNVDHCGELFMEDDDGACMTVGVRLRSVPSSKEGYLSAGTKCSVKGYVREMFDGELELEARWGDFVLENEPFSDPECEEQDDFDLGPRYSALELKQLDTKRRIRIRGTVLKRFEDVGIKYVGIVKVKSIGSQCVRVCFNWEALEEEPQDFILELQNGVEVELVGWAERKGAAVFMDASLIEILDEASDMHQNASAQGTPAAGSSDHVSFTFGTPEGSPFDKDAVKASRKTEYDGEDAMSPRDLLVHKAASASNNDASGSDAAHEVTQENASSSYGKVIQKNAVSSAKSQGFRLMNGRRFFPPSPKKLRSKGGAKKLTDGSLLPAEDHGHVAEVNGGHIRAAFPNEAADKETLNGTGNVKSESTATESVPKKVRKRPNKNASRKRKSSSNDAEPLIAREETVDLSSGVPLVSESRKVWAKGNKAV